MTSQRQPTPHEGSEVQHTRTNPPPPPFLLPTSPPSPNSADSPSRSPIRPSLDGHHRRRPSQRSIDPFPPPPASSPAHESESWEDFAAAFPQTILRNMFIQIILSIDNAYP
uniref:Uncharacterized protein n=1 Tax=Triticum urartu TaxID=4572 RepID=A0A8R7TZX4_TRIUA